MNGFRFSNTADEYDSQDCFVARMPANITTVDELFLALKTQLKFPEYFGFNWNAVTDCLRDFAWIEQRRIILVHQGRLMLSENELSIYVDVLAEAVSDWEDGEHSFEVVFRGEDREVVENILKFKGR
jgi:RNAse (barnase) inhibitor barstar